MPADIRSFFGGKPSQSSQTKTPAKKEEIPKARGRPSKKKPVIEDSDDEVVITKEVAPKKSTPKKPKKVESPKGTATTTSDYFGSSNKPKRSEPVKSNPVTKNPPSPTRNTTPKLASKTSLNEKATPIRTKQTTSYPKRKHDDDFEDLDNDDDIFTADFKANGKIRADDYEESSEEEEMPKPQRKLRRGGHGKQTTKIPDPDDYVPEDDDFDMKDVNPDDDFVVPNDDEEVTVDKLSKTQKKASTASKKRKSPEFDEDEEDEPPKKGKGKKAAAATKSPAKKKAKKSDEPDNASMQAIYDSIPTIKAPTPPPRDESKKFNYAAGAAHQAAAATPGSRQDLPTGADNCLAGLSFVFTGILQTLSREDGQALVKRYGGRVMGSASKKTSFVVLGSDAGFRKLETIRDHKLKTINEEGLFELIRRLPANGGDGKAAAAYEEKQKKEEAQVKEMAAEMEKEERKAIRSEGTGSGKTTTTSLTKGPTPAAKGPDDRLWTVKYAPTQINQICGNKGQVEKLQNWLRSFHKNQRHKFKMAGKDGSGVYRAVMIHGPPGIGKTTAAHLVAKLEGYDVVESNASDTRSKKLVEEGLRGVLSTTSLLGYFAGDERKVEASKKKMVLIMDEVDGMSAGDRGGVGALAAVCKKTQIPMILICNDRKLPKMKPFDYCTFDLPFRRPTVDQIRARIMTITYREGLKMPPPVVNALIEGSNADIRQVVNMVSTAKLDQEVMDFDQGKAMSKQWEKHVILKPWDITSKILGGGMFAESSKATLNDKIELYFNDHEFSPLMLQENYLGTQPMRASSYRDRERNLRILELTSQAADSISDGDLVDRMIHGSQQQWSLMPTHAVFSFVRPASYISGSMAGSQTRFTSWLGQNSKQGKLTRMVKEIQGHMRLRSSADRHEIRQQYIPSLWNDIVKRLEVDGKEAVPEIIEKMDYYFLTRDDFDAITELGVGTMDMEKLKIESQAKSTFTRLYNQQSHPLSFMKASSVVAPSKVSKEKPDLEEAIEESDEGEADVNDAAENEDETDLTKDKYIKAPKKKKAAPQKSAGKGKKKTKDEDEDEDSEDAPKPKKGKAKAKGKK